MQKPRKKRKRPETEFLRGFGGSWKKAGGYWYKIPDATGLSAMFSPARPYDIDAAMSQVIFAIEGKFTDNVCLHVSDFEKKKNGVVIRNQIDSLLEVSRQGYKAFALVCYGRLNKKVADFFSVDVLQQYRARGENKIDPEHAALRVYASTVTDWQIDPQAILNMTLHQKKLPELFPT